MEAGGWTVAFSSADKSKEERVVINVPKWPRVTGRASPVTALKRGHLHDHPSHRHTQIHTPCQCVCMPTCEYAAIKHWCQQLLSIRTHASRSSTHVNIRHVTQSLNTVDGYTHIRCTSVPLPSAGSWTLNTGWVAQRDR